MKIGKAEYLAILGAVCGLILFVGSLVYLQPNETSPLESNETRTLTFTIHGHIVMYKDGVKVFEFWHPGSVTKLGLNVTLAKITGNSTAYNMTQYNLNCTFLSIGNQGTLNTDSTELPGEWNRTTATQHDCAYNTFNLTAWIYPDAGPYTADCFGVNFEAGISNGALFAYDTFTEVTGIDDSFDIMLEFQISVA